MGHHIEQAKRNFFLESPQPLDTSALLRISTALLCVPHKTPCIGGNAYRQAKRLCAAASRGHSHRRSADIHAPILSVYRISDEPPGFPPVDAKRIP